MASSIIHYAVSLKILDKIKVNDSKRFLLGASLGPDASIYEDGTKHSSHYWELFDNDTKKAPDFLKFSEKHSDSILEDDFILGYYCHLIQDAIWFHDLVDVYVRCYTGEKKKEMYQITYNDYARYNYLLPKEFKLSKLSDVDLSVTLEEITEERLKANYEDFLTYFDAKPCKKEELEIYKWDTMISFINKAADLCIKQIKALKNGEKGISPKEFAVKK